MGDCSLYRKFYLVIGQIEGGIGQLEGDIGEIKGDIGQNEEDIGQFKGYRSTYKCN